MFNPKLALVLTLQFVVLALCAGLALLGERREPDDLLRPDSLGARHGATAKMQGSGWAAGIDLDGWLGMAARATALTMVPLSGLALWSGVPVERPLLTLILAAICAAGGFAARKTVNGSAFVALSFCAGVGALALVVGRLTHGFGGLPQSAAEGSVIGCTLLFGTAVSIRTGETGRQLFEAATVDTLQHNPLKLPFPDASTAQLRCALVAAVVGGWLAAGEVTPGTLGAVPAVLALLLAVGLQIWGWRAKELGPDGFLMTAAMAAVLTMFYRLVFAGPTGVRSLILALISARFISNLESPESPLLTAFAVVACALFLLGAYVLLSRPPDRLSSVLGHAPGWGWMLIGGLSAACAAACLPGNAALAVTLALTLCSGFLFVWLCQWE